MGVLYRRHLSPRKKKKNYSHWGIHITQESLWNQKKTFTHLSQLLSLLPKLLTPNTSFFVGSACLVHPTHLWGSEGARRTPSQQNKLHQPPASTCFSEELISFRLQQTRSDIRLPSLPAEQGNIQSKPCPKPVQISFHLLHHYINIQFQMFTDINLTLFSFTERCLLPVL